MKSKLNKVVSLTCAYAEGATAHFFTIASYPGTSCPGFASLNLKS
jgi:hypothetical protein